MQRGFTVISLAGKDPYFYTLFISLGDFGAKSQITAIKQLNLHPRASHSINTLPQPVERLRLLIGPEGGLTADEIAMTAQQGFTDILLGPRVLRTETTALTAITALQVRFGDLG